MDGVDAAAFKIRPANSGSSSNGGGTPIPSLQIEMIDSLLYEYDSLFQRKLKKLVAAAEATLDEFCRLDAALGVVFSHAANSLMRKAGLTRHTVDLIGSHGQTIWHAPNSKSFWGIPTRNTTQLGQPAIIAANTGVKVISDFRSADMAFGGQGAPLTPFADQVLFAGQKRSMGVLNLGGIANITILNEHGQAVMAYDAGPGNSLIDYATALLFDRSYDDQGSLAAGGKVDKQWLDELKSSEPYYAYPPPKTTGRELFGNSYADSLCRQGLDKGLNPADLLATLTALTASVVADSYRDFVAPSIKIEELVLGGGGGQNTYLRQMLTSYWPHPLKLSTHEDYGISSKFKESLLFALLSYTTYFGIPNNVPSCTGASRHLCLGRLSLPD
jgi:anhydro-N-acetylmuramic acid kinase